ncbi:MAG: tetratricopeptide repeat protein [Azospirillaceae bacterium]|nr:tetratricopeptide repeat protein [Azospirillaceae bacterium]
MSDIFREVDDDLRRERLEKVWRHVGPYLLAGAIAILAGTAGYVAWDKYRTRQAIERTSALISATEKVTPAIEGGDVQAALAALAAVQPQLGGAPATLARLQEAGLKAAAGDKAGAIALYDQIAGSADNDPLFRDLAQIMAVMQQVDTGNPAQLQSRIAGLAAKGPWRYTALELSGLLYIRANDLAKAKEIFQSLSVDPAAPMGVRNRAADLAALYAEQK